jgi:hypothetical protein
LATPDGTHQFHFPIKGTIAGNSNVRTITASTTIPTAVACPTFYTIDKGKSIVKGKILLSVAKSNAE